MSSRLAKFLKERSGASAAEFAIIVLVFVMLIFGTIDFGRALWEWNQAQKATQIGVRFAVVNTIVANAFKNFDGLACGVGNGVPVPVGCLPGNPITCTSASCSNGTRDAAAFDAVLAQVQSIYPAVLPANLVVEYRHDGFGYVGDPFGSDITPTVTVRLQNMVFDFLTPGLVGVLSINMPDFAATLTGEDLAP